jgi:hypothetical protein
MGRKPGESARITPFSILLMGNAKKREKSGFF